MDMESPLIQFLLNHGYWIMFLLMYLEGPVVTMAAAFLAKMGHFSVPAVLFVSIVGDIMGDIVLYWVGKKYGMRFVKGPGRYLGLKYEMIEKMQGFFDHHGGKTIFLVKSTTGLCFVTFVAAGMAKMPFKKFLLFSFFGGIIWSTTLVALGYFFGYLYQEIAQYLSYAGWVILLVALFSFLVITVYKKKKAEEYFGETDAAKRVES